MSYQYGQEAKDRISALGQVEIAEFIDEIPMGFRKPFYDRQAPIPGFRRGTIPELKKKQERLINHLVHPSAGPKGEADWKLFSNFWVAWAKSKLDVDFPDSGEISFLPDAGIAFLTHLLENFPDASREVVERLLRFSGFDNQVETLAAVGSFHPASLLARDRMIDGLPGRLDQIEERIEIAEPAVAEASKRIDHLESDLVEIVKTVDRIVSGISQVDSEACELRSALHQISTTTEKLESTARLLSDADRQNFESMSAIDRRIESLEQSLEALLAEMEKWAAYSFEVSALREAVDQVREHEPSWTENAEAIEAVGNRLELLELSISKGGNNIQTKSQVRIFETELPGPFVDISSPETACETIAWNLQACGVVKGNAFTAARQILAALTTGQIVQFTGSIADLVAETVAAAVSGPVFHEWRVPVGLASDEVATECLEILAESSGGLVLKGANRSAFEVYGTAIRDVVVRRQYAALDYRNLAFIASWTQGPAAFPDGGVITELGPVFDTDAFRMRGGRVNLPVPKYGHLMSGTWDTLLDADFAPVASLIKDLKDKLQDAGFAPGNLWLRSAERALVRLRMLPGACEEEDLHSLLMFWALPWARATEGPTDALGRLAAQALADAPRDVAQLEGN